MDTREVVLLITIAIKVQITKSQHNDYTMDMPYSVT